jgi:hypothetical protein
MALLTHLVGFGESGGDLVVNFLDALKAKRVKMISWRESFDAAEARTLQAPRQDDRGRRSNSAG